MFSVVVLDVLFLVSETEIIKMHLLSLSIFVKTGDFLLPFIFRKCLFLEVVPFDKNREFRVNSVGHPTGCCLKV
jgi:hypothetical protein